MTTATKPKPIIIRVPESDFLAKYGDVQTSVFIPLFNRNGLSIYLDKYTEVIYIVESS